MQLPYIHIPCQLPNQKEGNTVKAKKSKDSFLSNH